MGRRVECAVDSLDAFGFDFFIGTGAVSHNETAGASGDLGVGWAERFPRY
jgi:hypothetical protein